MKLTRADIIKYITLINAEFPSRELDGETLKLRAEMWYKVLSEYSKEEVDSAVCEAITSSEYAPRIKNIADICKRNRNPYSLSPIDLWNEVIAVMPQVEEAVKEIRLGANRAWNERLQDYGQETYFERGWRTLEGIFSRLRPEIRRYYGNRPVQLVTLSDMTTESREYEKARFLKAVQPFIDEAETAARVGAGEYFEQLAGGQKKITSKSEGE